MLLADYKNKTVKDKATGLTEGALTVHEKLKNIFKYVRDDIKFQFPMEGDLIPASKIIENGYGQCNNKSTLFLALCKAAGIPARIHFSLISKEIQKGFFKGIPYQLIPDEISHSWVEVYVDGKWMKIDGYINDKTLHDASLKKLSELNWEVGFSVANKTHNANPDLNFEDENFVQMSAVTESHGVYDDPSEYYKTPFYKNRPSAWKMYLYKQVIDKVNQRVKRLRTNYLITNLSNKFTSKY